MPMERLSRDARCSMWSSEGHEATRRGFEAGSGRQNCGRKGHCYGLVSQFKYGQATGRCVRIS
jgi:hypothetical protein